MIKHNGHRMLEEEEYGVELSDETEQALQQLFDEHDSDHAEDAEEFARLALEAGHPSSDEDLERQQFRKAALMWKKFGDRMGCIIASWGVLPGDCLLLAMGKFTLLGLAGSKNPEVSLAEKHHVTKAAVSKYVKQYQRMLGLGDLAARKDTSKMRQSRLGQLAVEDEKADA